MRFKVSQQPEPLSISWYRELANTDNMIAPRAFQGRACIFLMNRNHFRRGFLAIPSTPSAQGLAAPTPYYGRTSNRGWPFSAGVGHAGQEAVGDDGKTSTQLWKLYVGHWIPKLLFTCRFRNTRFGNTIACRAPRGYQFLLMNRSHLRSRSHRVMSLRVFGDFRWLCS